MVEPWVEAGHKCTVVDIKHQRRGPHRGIYFWNDSILTTSFGRNFDMVFAFPPCAHLSGSGARWWAGKGEAALGEGLALFDRCIEIAEATGAPYMVENPVGRIPRYRRKWDFIFNPCDYGGYLEPPGDMYTKKTCLWTGGGFIMPEPKPVLPLEGSAIHRLPPSEDRARLRSLTPRGFAQAVFEANVKT